MALGRSSTGGPLPGVRRCLRKNGFSICCWEQRLRVSDCVGRCTGNRCCTHLPKIFLCSAKELHVAKLRLALAAAPLAVCPGPGNYRDLIVVWVAGGGLLIDGEGAERILGIVPSPLW